jgi:DNA-binding protein Fis
MENKRDISTDNTNVTLRENVAEVMQHYFASLKGEEPTHV